MTDDVILDWRLHGVTTLASDIPAAYPGGPVWKKGDYAILLSVSKATEESLFSYYTPSPVSLPLNIAIQAASEAKSLEGRIVTERTMIQGAPAYVVPNTQIESFFDSLERRIACAVFSYQAIEAFCNLSIDKELTGGMKMKLAPKNHSKERGSSYIQRNVSTGTKLAQVLPNLLHVKDPSKAPVWDRFKALEKIRHDLVHFKSWDAYNKDSDHQTVLDRLREYDIVDAPRTALELIEHFTDLKSRTGTLVRARELIERL